MTFARAAALALVGVLTASGGCGGPDTAPPSTTGESSGTDACQASADCNAGVCVAPWDRELVARGPAVCALDCVADDDLARFCIDDAACCPGSRCNDADGLCAAIDRGTSDGSTTGAAEGSSTDTGTTGG